LRLKYRQLRSCAYQLLFVHSTEAEEVKATNAQSVSLSRWLGGREKKRELVDILFPFAEPAMIISVVVMLVVLVLEIHRRIP
jgi:hypothetical protein